MLTIWNKPTLFVFVALASIGLSTQRELHGKEISSVLENICLLREFKEFSELLISRIQFFVL